MPGTDLIEMAAGQALPGSPSVSVVKLSKTRVDRAGAALARERYRTDDEYLEADDIVK